MERKEDVQLIHDILSGNDDAFSTLVQKYQRSVHALAWRKISNFHYAEEITQDTFLQAYKKLSTLKNPHHSVITGFTLLRECAGCFISRLRRIALQREVLDIEMRSTTG